MNRKTMLWAVMAAITALLATAAVALADIVPADGDAVATGNQTFIDLGQAGPGENVDWSVAFTLTCAGLTHATPGATIHLNLSGGTVPLDGAATVVGTTIGPVPANWTPANVGCPSPAPTVSSNGPSLVTLRMPTTPGDDYQFTLVWSKTGTTGLTGMSTITFQADVVPNTPPQLVLPPNQSLEATSPAGAIATYIATATDAEDSTAPTPTCSPVSGSTFPIGTTEVACDVTDSGGLSDHGSFFVTVVDTTPPSLVGMPGDVSLTTNDPSGTTLTYVPPAGTDISDPSPTVDCLPASGTAIPVGPTTVTCTATDASGNQASDSFRADVHLNTAPVLSVPNDMTREATSAAGAAASFTVTATDGEDGSSLVPVCSPASGSTFPLGTTTVNCVVTDSGGLMDHGSFNVTVADTTAPVMANIADFAVTTNDPTGTTVDYGHVSVVEAVDPSPSIVCLPASGSKFPIGTTTVTCTARDASGNQSTMSFRITVSLVSSATWTAVWREPVGQGTDSLSVNGSRTLPVKVEMFADGVEQTAGNGMLTISGCTSSWSMTMPLSWDGGKWTGHLDTGSLAGPGCYLVGVSLDGNAAGSFRLDVKGVTAAAGPASQGAGKGSKSK
jgi:hypothetical protein